MTVGSPLPHTSKPRAVARRSTILVQRVARRRRSALPRSSVAPSTRSRAWTGASCSCVDGGSIDLRRSHASDRRGASPSPAGGRRGMIRSLHLGKIMRSDCGEAPARALPQLPADQSAGASVAEAIAAQRSAPVRRRRRLAIELLARAIGSDNLVGVARTEGL